MDSIVELVKRNEQLLLENAEALNDEEVEQEDIDEYLKIQGATKEELSAFENQFQIRLPEDFKTVYSYKNGSGYMSLIWPQEGFYRGYRLLSLKEIIKLKSLFQNKNCKMTEFPNVIGEKQLQQLDERIKPYLFCERWFPFAEYAGSLYLMLDYNPSEKGEIGQIICYVHDPDFIYYVAPNITEALKMTETVIENLSSNFWRTLYGLDGSDGVGRCQGCGPCGGYRTDGCAIWHLCGGLFPFGRGSLGDRAY